MDFGTFLVIVFVVVVIGTVASVGGSLAFGPPYRVWSQRLKGQADLAQAEAETRIAIRRADAEYEAAKHYAMADVERAKGISASIREVEGALGGPEGYLRWKYIHMLEEQDGVSQIVYLPTEAGLPILEAGKRK